MTAVGIYPGGWHEDDGERLFAAFRALRDFYGDAAGRGSPVLTCLV